jgi:hypothetical protein
VLPSVAVNVIVFDAVNVFPDTTESPVTVAEFPVQDPDDPEQFPVTFPVSDAETVTNVGLLPVVSPETSACVTAYCCG